MASKFTDDSDVISDINITPFVDIILVVLIIFMVTAATIVESSIKVNLPEASTGEATEQSSVGVTLLDTGALLLDGLPVTPEVLSEGLRARKDAGEDVIVLIAADELVAHGRVVWLMDLVKSVGIGKFAINIDKASALPPDPATVGRGTATGG